MDEFNIQVKNKTTTSNVGITSTDSAGNSQVKHTDKCTILVASHVTLYIQVREQKEETVGVFFVLFRSSSPFLFNSIHTETEHSNTQLWVALVPSRKKHFVIWTSTALNIQSCPNALVCLFVLFFLIRGDVLERRWSAGLQCK